MALLINFLYFAGSLVILIIAGSLLVKSGSKVAQYLRMPEFVLGFIVMAIATSIPELFVGIASAIEKNPALSLGNVIGSNIVNITLIAGISILLGRKIKVKIKEARTDSIAMVLISALPILLMFIGKELSRLDGVILLITFVAYYLYVLKQRRHYTKELNNSNISKKSAVSNSIIIPVSIFILFISARWTVTFGSLIATDMNFPPIMIGLFLIALGTSLPELVFSSRAAMTGHSDMSIGNLIGSNITNASLILGVTAIIYPIQANFILFLTGAIYMIVVSLVFTGFIESRRFTWISGIALITLYIFFLMVEFYVKTL